MADELDITEFIEPLDNQDPDEYAALKEDFALVVNRGIPGFQESAPGREILHAVIRLQGRHGIVVETNDRGLISMPEMSSTVVDNQGKARIQRMMMGMSCSASTKSTAFNAANLLRKGDTIIKEFEVNAAAYELLKRTIEESQKDGEDVQRQIDEGDYQYFPRDLREPAMTASFSMDNSETINPTMVFELISQAKAILKKQLGAKLETCKVVFFSIVDSCELADAVGKADTAVRRTGFAIEVKTSKGHKVFKALRGTGGMNVLTRYMPIEESHRWDKAIEGLAHGVVKNAIDLDRAQSAAILKGEAHLVLSPEVVGVLVHEVYGHTSEADIIIDNKHNKGSDINLKSRLGGQVSENAKFNLIDDGAFEVQLGADIMRNCYGGIALDDDGIVGKRTQLVTNGIQTLVMNSADTINEIATGLPTEAFNKMMEHGLTGNLRSETFNCPPIVRMTSTFALPDEEGPNSVAELAAMVPTTKRGIYVATCAGGWVRPDTGDFQINGELGYLIENGTVTDKPVKDIVIRGNITKFGSKIKSIGSSKTITSSFTGWCGKDQQYVPVEGGGPAILVEDAVVGSTIPRWSWAEQAKEYRKQSVEVSMGLRRPQDIFFRFVDEEEPAETEEEQQTKPANKSHMKVCMVTASLDMEDEVDLLLGRTPHRSSYILGERGELVEEN